MKKNHFLLIIRQYLYFVGLFITLMLYYGIICPSLTQAQLVIPKETPVATPQPKPEDKPRPNIQKPVPSTSVETPSNGSFDVLGYGIVSANILKLRASPSLSGDVKDMLDEGANVKVIRIQNDWVFVEAISGGKTGWVHRDYLLLGAEYDHVTNLQGTRRLQGTWRGNWEKNRDNKSDAILHIAHLDDTTIVAAGKVDGWSCWEIFLGKIEGNKVFLKGITVLENQRPASEYVSDELYLKLSEVGLRIEGGWTDPEGSSGKVEYRFFSMEDSMDKNIWQVLKEKKNFKK